VRVLTILARFGTRQYADAEDAISDIFRRRMPEVDRTVLVVDNALPEDHPAPERCARMLLAGDNSAREFSGFDRAVRFIGQDLCRFDLVHFATSAFNRLYTEYLERFDTRVLESVVRRPACLGHIDGYSEPVEILDVHTQHWIRTGFFILPPREVKMLGSFVTIRDGRRFFSGDPDAPFLEQAPLSRRYRRYIIDWLTGLDIGQGVKWHSHFPVTSETLPSFEHKALSILNEHLLAVRLRAMGCRLIDVTWATTMLAGGRAASIQWDTAWQRQLASRDRDAVVFR
jgi:hypothetical protein